MSAFAGAVEAGAHAIETDVHLSKDGVVVLAHVSFISYCTVFLITFCDFLYCLSLLFFFGRKYSPIGIKAGGQEQHSPKENMISDS